MADFPFCSYCWALGTTSFRTADFNFRIERQLDLLSRFRLANTGEWQDLQGLYYHFMQVEGFVGGAAPNPAKDAREKTSGLVKLGLVDAERRLTNAGRALLAITHNGKFGEDRDNDLQIPADSFIYLKQLLKTSDARCGAPVRPYVVLAYALAEFDALSEEEYTYLLPLCTGAARTEQIFGAIRQVRAGAKRIDDVVASTLLEMDNYQAARAYFLQAEAVTADVMLKIGMNRKSGSGGLQGYDAALYQLYQTLHRIVFKPSEPDATDAISTLLTCTKNIVGNTRMLWRNYLFETQGQKSLEPPALNKLPILQASSETEFRTEFFRLLHLFKAKATLADYADLNRRYFQTTDTVLFSDGKVQLDALPKCWLREIAAQLPTIAFSDCDLLCEDVSLEEIAPFLKTDTQKLYADLERLFGVAIHSGEGAKEALKRERYTRFHKLIDEKFSPRALVALLGKFENRKYEDIRKYVTNNADIPTIFEYVLGIAWYHVSGRQGDVLDYMNLSLEADLLPRTHAAGGAADIEWRYSATNTHPQHTLLLEATLSDSTNQRRMEMEPVSRHLGEHILKTGNENTYCVFISTFLHPNLVSDFHNRRSYAYYQGQYEKAVHGLKIVPLATSELRAILVHNIPYSRLYEVFETAYRSNEPVPRWYEREVRAAIAKDTRAKK